MAVAVENMGSGSETHAPVGWVSYPVGLWRKTPQMSAPLSSLLGAGPGVQVGGGITAHLHDGVTEVSRSAETRP